MKWLIGILGALLAVALIWGAIEHRNGELQVAEANRLHGVVDSLRKVQAKVDTIWQVKWKQYNTPGPRDTITIATGGLTIHYVSKDLCDLTIGACRDLVAAGHAVDSAQAAENTALRKALRKPHLALVLEGEGQLFTDSVTFAGSALLSVPVKGFRLEGGIRQPLQGERSAILQIRKELRLF